MRFDVFTLFPAFFQTPDGTGPLGSSILKRGREAGALQVHVHDIRAWTSDRHHVCDDAPYGGGAGMVMKAEPVARAVEDVLNYDAGSQAPPCPVVLLSPQGRKLSQQVARELSRQGRLALLCGHYEGIDERAVELLATDEISIGDYVLTGGETAALVLLDAVARLVPGVLGNEASAPGDSFWHGLLEAPHYTRPVVWRDKPVPDVLLSGHHGEVEKWRRRESLKRTLLRRPDLLHGREWTPEEQKLLSEVRAEMGVLNQAENDTRNEDEEERQ